MLGLLLNKVKLATWEHSVVHLRIRLKSCISRVNRYFTVGSLSLSVFLGKLLSLVVWVFLITLYLLDSSIISQVHMCLLILKDLIFLFNWRPVLRGLRHGLSPLEVYKLRRYCSISLITSSIVCLALINTRTTARSTSRHMVMSIAGTRICLVIARAVKVLEILLGNIGLIGASWVDD